MKEYILKGEPAEVGKVIRENRIRISRGVISITPAEPEESVDADTMKTLCESMEFANKECDRLHGSMLELSELTRSVVSIAVEEGGLTVPEDLAARLADYGVIVPVTEETAKDTAVIMDDKIVDAEDFKEVDLDADSKEVPDEDVKETPDEDVKETTPQKKTSRSKKKSE